jgi:hypothetical protein
MLRSWLNRKTLEQLISLAAVSVFFATAPFALPNFVFVAMTHHLALAFRLGFLLLPLSGGLFLLWCAFQVIKCGVAENRWSKSRLEFWRHYFRLTDWPIFLAFVVIWLLWSHYGVFVPAFALMRTHTLIMNALREPPELFAIPDGIWGRWESMKPLVSNQWGEHTQQV